MTVIDNKDFVPDSQRSAQNFQLLPGNISLKPHAKVSDLHYIKLRAT